MNTPYTCRCRCSNCAREEAHYSGYHCHHWVYEYGELESLGACVLDLFAARDKKGSMLAGEREKFDRKWLLAQRGY